MKKLPILLIILLSVLPLFSLTVTDLQSAMMGGNPDIMKAREEVSKASLDVKDAKSGYSPTIDLTITGSYIANPIDPIRVNLGDYINTTTYGIPNDYVTIYNGQESMYYQFQLSLTQPVFTWGKITNAVRLYQKVYDARVLQMEDAIEKAQTELRTRVAALYYLLQIQKLLESQREIADKLVGHADNAQQNGMMLATDALKIKVQSRQIDVAKAQIDQQIVLMVTELRNLTGLKDLTADDIEFDEAEFDAKLDALKGTEYSTLSSRCLSDSRTTFQLLGALSQIAELTNDIAGASVNWKPDMALVVNADYSGSRLPFAQKDWYGKDDWSATITFALKTTIVDGGKAVRNVKRTESAVSEAQMDIQSAKAKVQSAVDENWTNLSVYLAQIDYQDALQSQLEAQGEVDKQLLDTGYGSESDYLQGQLESNNCGIEILRTRISLATAVYTLLYLQGDRSL
ncbi:MAG: TolC family protein [Sphaerochaetaceae bacterium]|nr:TolC family protein [Sphaerochaetaceae bacterium]